MYEEGGIAMTDKEKKEMYKKKVKKLNKTKFKNRLKKFGLVGVIIAVMGIIGAACLFYGGSAPKKNAYVGKILSITALEEKKETVPQIKRLTYNDMLIVCAVKKGEYDGDNEVVQAALEGVQNDKLEMDDVQTADGSGVDIDKVKARTQKYKLNDIQENLTLTATASMVMTTTGNTGTAIIATPEQIQNAKYLGKFLCTAYCPCVKCCGKSDGITASGKKATPNHTIATDRNFAFGTQLIIGNQIYTVEDRGGNIKGNRIDVYFNTHQEALNWGKKTLDIYLYTVPN